MAEKEKIIRAVAELNRMGIKPIPRHVIVWGDIYYSERWVRELMRRLASEGALVRIGARRGYAVPGRIA